MGSKGGRRERREAEGREAESLSFHYTREMPAEENIGRLKMREKMHQSSLNIQRDFKRLNLLRLHEYKTNLSKNISILLSFAWP